MRFDQRALDQPHVAGQLFGRFDPTATVSGPAPDEVHHGLALSLHFRLGTERANTSPESARTSGVIFWAKLVMWLVMTHIEQITRNRRHLRLRESMLVSSYRAWLVMGDLQIVSRSLNFAFLGR